MINKSKSTSLYGENVKKKAEFEYNTSGYVKKISFNKGKFHCIFGKNGTGKTELCNQIRKVFNGEKSNLVSKNAFFTSHSLEKYRYEKNDYSKIFLDFNVFFDLFKNGGTLKPVSFNHNLEEYIILAFKNIFSTREFKKKINENEKELRELNHNGEIPEFNSELIDNLELFLNKNYFSAIKKDKKLKALHQYIIDLSLDIKFTSKVSNKIKSFRTLKVLNKWISNEYDKFNHHTDFWQDVKTELYFMLKGRNFTLREYSYDKSYRFNLEMNEDLSDGEAARLSIELIITILYISRMFKIGTKFQRILIIDDASQYMDFEAETSLLLLLRRSDILNKDDIAFITTHSIAMANEINSLRTVGLYKSEVDKEIMLVSKLETNDIFTLYKQNPTLLNEISLLSEMVKNTSKNGNKLDLSNLNNFLHYNPDSNISKYFELREEYFAKYSFDIISDFNFDSYESFIEKIDNEIKHIENWTCWDIYSSRVYIESKLFKYTGIKDTKQSLFFKMQKYEEINQVGKRTKELISFKMNDYIRIINYVSHTFGFSEMTLNIYDNNLLNNIGYRVKSIETEIMNHDIS